MNYYDHASMQKLKLGPWAVMGASSGEADLEKGRRDETARRLRAENPPAPSGRWAGLFACFCWFV